MCVYVYYYIYCLNGRFEESFEYFDLFNLFYLNI